MKMPFGKYRGRHVEHLPSQYLQWLASQDWLHDDLRAWVEAEVTARGLDDHTEKARSAGITLFIDEADVATAKELVASGRKAAALRHHPDKGGNLATMQRVNRVADTMTKQLQIFEVHG